MRYKFDHITEYPLIKRNQTLPTTNSRDYNCAGFEDSSWLPTLLEVCENCPHLASLSGVGDVKDYK